MSKEPSDLPREPTIKPETAYSPINAVPADDNPKAEKHVRPAETSPVEHGKRTGLTLSDDEAGTAGGNRDH